MSLSKTALWTTDGTKPIRLAEVNADATGDYSSKEDAKPRLKQLGDALELWQERLYAEGKQSLLVVIQAMDTGGKDGATRNLLRNMDPVGYGVTSFKSPTSLELAHDFLWRVHAATPQQGFVAVWNRSHYEDILIGRVRNLVPEPVWQARYEHINNFESLLHANSTRILKFYLHISKDEQKRRLQSRLTEPEKHWKFNLGDLKEREKWDEYQEAYEDAINRCSTPTAPWNIVPANHKWSRDIAIAEKVVATLEEMNPQYPRIEFDPASILVD